MKPEIYVDQSAAALRLTVCEAELDTGQFNLLEQGSFKTPQLQLEAAIIGASHLLSFRRPGFVLNEVFACVDVMTSGRKLASCQSLAEMTTLTLKGAQWHYSFKSRVVRVGPSGVQPSELKKMVGLSKNRGQLHLVHEFPQCPDDRWAPQTLVVAESSLGGILVDTAHAYPNEGKVVLTQTLLKEVN